MTADKRNDEFAQPKQLKIVRCVTEPYPQE